MGEEDCGGVVVALASPAGAFFVGFGELGLASALDELFGAVCGECVEELFPVGDAEALDESGRSVAEEGGAADVGGW
jgi:hypothetical protein